MIELVVFLGNPEKKYLKTRHNAGWLLTEYLSFFNDLLWETKFKGSWAVLESQCFFKSLFIHGEKGESPSKIHFLMPHTYMNNSGESVLAAASFFKIPYDNIIIVHDELELSPGTISLKYGGGLCGHNGLRSIKACLGTSDFWRLRIGIGRPDSRIPGEGGPPGSGEGIIDWVLTKFSQEELPVLQQSLNEAANLLINILRYGPEDLLSEWSKRKVTKIEN